MSKKFLPPEEIYGYSLRYQEANGGVVGVAYKDGKQIAHEIASSKDAARDLLLEKINRSDRNFVGYSGGIVLFKKRFSDFYDQGYLEIERNYKVEAKRKLDDRAPLHEAVDGRVSGKDVLSAFAATNLPYETEKKSVANLLKGPKAEDFIRGAAAFAMGDVRGGLRDMKKSLMEHDAISWVLITYLPFLWRPEEHMFLKPEITQELSKRVGHYFHEKYKATPDVGVYEALRDLAGTTKSEISELRPRDNIDVQGFIWVTCSGRTPPGQK